jgi:tetratricopeptide (TPR) repeat protein
MFQNQQNEAGHLFRRSLAEIENSPGKCSLRVVSALDPLSIFYWMIGQYSKAEATARRALECLRATDGELNPSFASLLGTLGHVKFEEGKLQEAAAYVEQTVRIQRINNPGDLSGSLCLLASIRRRQKRLDAAAGLYEEGIALEDGTNPPPPVLASLLNGLAQVWLAKNRGAESRALNERAIAIAEKALGPDHLSFGAILQDHAAILRAAGQRKEAKEYARRANRIQTAYAASNLARHTVDVKVFR